MEGVPPATKAALTRAYNERSKSRMVRAADLVTLPGPKKAPKKRIAAMLEPTDEGGLGEENAAGEDGAAALEEHEDENNTSDAEGKYGRTVSYVLFSSSYASILLCICIVIKPVGEFYLIMLIVKFQRMVARLCKRILKR